MPNLVIFFTSSNGDGYDEMAKKDRDIVKDTNNDNDVIMTTQMWDGNDGCDNGYDDGYWNDSLDDDDRNDND